MAATFNFLFGIAMFPYLISWSADPAWNLTIYNSASSTKTLGVMSA